jgi:hypothetical protein
MSKEIPPGSMCLFFEKGKTPKIPVTKDDFLKQKKCDRIKGFFLVKEKGNFLCLVSFSL